MSFHLVLRAGIAALSVVAVPALAQNTVPGANWSTFVGGNDPENQFGATMSTAGNGDLLLVGTTRSASLPFPMTGAYQGTHGGNPPTGSLFESYGDGLFARIRADGSSVVWASFLGGADADYIADIAESPGDLITVCGSTTSSDFDGMENLGAGDGFVARFRWNGKRLVKLWSVLLGTEGNDTASALEIHPSGLIVVAGTTDSPTFPGTAGRYQPANAGGFDHYVAVLDASGNLQYATFVGGAGHDGNNRGSPFAPLTYLVLDAAGQPTILGWRTRSVGFPTTPGALRPTFCGGSYDGLLVRLNLTLTQATYASYVGGSDNEWFWDLKAAPSGSVTVVGTTWSTDYPVTDGSSYRGGSCPGGIASGDATVTTLDLNLPGSQSLLWSTYLGTPGCEQAMGVAVDGCGAVTVAGFTSSAAFPITPGAFQGTFGGGSGDSFVMRFDPPSGGVARMVYSTFVGSAAFDMVRRVCLDGLGNAVVAGITDSTNFPTTPGSLQPTYGGGTYDMFVTKLTMLPVQGNGVVRYGASTAACPHPIWQDVDALPQPGMPFTIRAHGAAPNALGTMFVGLEDRAGWTLSNLDVLLAAGGPIIGLGTQANAAGCGAIQLALPSSLPFAPVASQWVFATDPAAGCAGTGALSSSEGLRWW
ncbi:MAG: hypothetical protein IPM29_29185 [Planctomycetes bacterium]|nr:hypothetical protein [Planctomycetota bacterium]